MTYPHETIEQRMAHLEASVARLFREVSELTLKLAKAPPAVPAAGSPGAVALDVDKWTQEWIASWSERGIPVARVALPHECRKEGGGGKGDWAGDIQVKYDPKFWKKESYVGHSFSQCPPDYLDMHANADEYRAWKNLQDPEKKKYAKYSLRQAALAKGWARMLREDPGIARMNVFAGNEPLGDISDANEDFPF